MNEMRDAPVGAELEAQAAQCATDVRRETWRCDAADVYAQMRRDTAAALRLALDVPLDSED